MAQGLSTTNQKGDSPAGRVMDEAIKLNIAGRSPYPKRASFIDVDSPYVGESILRAVGNDMATLRESLGKARVNRSIRRLRAKVSARTARRGR